MDRPELEKKVIALEQRVKKLAAQKSHFQMESEIITAMAATSGIEELVETAVNAIMNAFGGSNVIIYYEFGGKWHCRDISTPDSIIDKIENVYILKAIYTGEFLEYKEDSIAEEMDSAVTREAPNTNIFPLKLNDQVFGVMVIKGILSRFETKVRDELRNIIKYLTLAMKNEINSSNLMLQAYDSLVEKRRQLEREIDEKTKEQIKFRNTINSSFDGFWIVSESMEFIYVNNAYCRLSGYSKEELIGRRIDFVEAQEDFRQIEKRKKIIIDKKRDRFETCHKKKNGSIIDVEINVNRSREDGLFYTFIRDITEKKELEKYQNQVSKMESIGRLAGGVAHDLNNLLTPILAYGDLLARNLEDDNRKRADMILKAGMSAREIVQQLLAFSRKQDLTYKVRNLNDIIQEFSNLLYRTIREDLSFTIDLCETELPVCADSSQIDQVLMNLIINAQDSIDSGKGIIKVRTSVFIQDCPETADIATLPPGPYARLSIQDNGCGMDQFEKENIFEPFFSTKGDMGTGLGLATVYGIIEQHRGKIAVQSEEGIGTEFSVYLPLHSKQTLLETDENQSQETEIKNCTILIVEDSEDIRNMIGDLLSHHGLTIHKAPDSSSALEILKKNRSINLLLTDIIMPELSGTGLYEKMKQIREDLKVIFMSGYSNEILKEYKIDRKSGTFIQKPFTIEQLLNTIKECC